MKKLTARYEKKGKDELLTIEGDMNLEFVYTNLHRPVPLLFTARDSDSMHMCNKPYVSYWVGSRSEFLDLFERLKKRGLDSGEFELSLPPIPDNNPLNR